MFKVYGFCTANTPYEGAMDFYLRNSLKKFNEIKYVLLSTPSLGSWQKNTSLKPKLILDWMNQSTDNSDLVILDADAEIVKYPVLFDEIPQEYDMACHFLDWKTWYNNGEKKELLSGTLFIRNNDKMKELVKTWAYLAEQADKWEQKVLQDLLENEFKDKIMRYPLPLEYCYITELPGGRKPRVECDPVIKHYQVSRSYKKLVDKQRVK